jgi:hypothetical protein
MIANTIGADMDAEQLQELYQLARAAHAITDFEIKARALLARQPAAIDKQCTCKGVLGHSRQCAMFDESMMSITAPLANGANKPAPSVEQDERGRFDKALMAYAMEFSESIDAGRIRAAHKRVMELFEARAASTSANVAQNELQVRGRMRLKVEKLAGSLTKAEETKNDIIGDDGEQVTGVRIGWGAWALLRASIIDLIEYKCDSDSALAAAYSANVAQGAEAKLEFMPVDSMQHAIVYGSTEAIGALKTRMERDYRIASLVPAPPAQTALTDDARDAARYRWIRDGEKDVFCVIGSNGPWGECGHQEIYDERLDDRIDAALTAAQSEGGK